MNLNINILEVWCTDSCTGGGPLAWPGGDQPKLAVQHPPRDVVVNKVTGSQKGAQAWAVRHTVPAHSGPAKPITTAQ